MSVYDKSLEQIQSSYQFTDLEMAKMDYIVSPFRRTAPDSTLKAEKNTVTSPCFSLP